MAIPAIAPLLRPEFRVAATAAGVVVDVGTLDDAVEDEAVDDEP